ncbi:hypothetical protein [Kyrpidia sp.]|uniref:hypothetical protein n=1 Tax=Kyrpidia sp. TaxID=2073077 RepID=UPI00258D5030|nr:hypothetical protein [Kyrpidia sp.]MCL6576924.1 hypothetical protein [Kyrpidia sp.]
MRIEFEVDGKPPRKNGATSMWGKDDEIARLVSLRRKALEAMEKEGISDCFRSFVKLELTLFLPRSDLERGDLDNFITGICDGLQAVNSNPRTKIHHEFLKPENEGIHPSRALLLENDSKIISINARKVLRDNRELSYKIVIESVDL